LNLAQAMCITSLLYVYYVSTPNKTLNLNLNLIEQYVITFVSDLGQVGGFLMVLHIPLPIKLSATVHLITIRSRPRRFHRQFMKDKINRK
jgi:hypothetical protein